MNKVIIIDFGIVVHKSIFAWPNNKDIPPTYIGMNMMLGWLYRLDLAPDDQIIIACDARNCWRKDFEEEYKGNRQQKRIDSGIPFDKFYAEFNSLKDRLNSGLNWSFIEVPRCEADDIMAVACRYYFDKEVILCTYDADLQQMWHYSNVKIFSPMTKKWKIKLDNFDVNRLIAEKVYKETTDNMISPILNEQDYEKRRLCVDLTTLPEWVENAVIEELKKIQPKQHNIECIPFKSLWPRMVNLYNDKSKVISYDSQVAKELAEEERLKRKKIEAKEKIKRAKEREKKKLAKLNKLDTEAKVCYT